MKLSQIYSNDERFASIVFNPGLNVVLASISDISDSMKDTHNLGKTTLASLIDFCLLRGVDKNFFLVKHLERFSGFEFYLEVKTNHDEFVTLRRCSASPSKVSIKKNRLGLQDCRKLGELGWDHHEIPLDRAKSILDGLLDLRVIAGWDYRDAVGYSLRVQKDYNDVFQLGKFRGTHSEWKPFLAHILGLNGDLVREKFKLDEDLEKQKQVENQIKGELAGLAEAPDLLEGMILSKRDDISLIENDVSSYDFKISDKQINKDLVKRIEAQIAMLNNRQYEVTMSLDRIEASLSERMTFDLKKTEAIFGDVKILFPDKLKRNFEELVAFNKALSEEREQYLKQDIETYRQELMEIDTELAQLSAQRVDALASLRELETFEKYKRLNGRLVSLKADLESLERQREAIKKLKNTAKLVRDIQLRLQKLAEKMQEMLESPSRKYSEIRRFFHEIIKRTINQDATLFTKVNTKGNIEFAAQIHDENGVETSRDEGRTYRKLLCIAFDMSLLRSYLDDSYIRFVYHDGALESLDDRKKINLISVMREYADVGIQQVITAIESDLPLLVTGERMSFSDGDIVRRLHDRGDDGKLFNMPGW